jgi:hypothetical protein
MWGCGDVVMWGCGDVGIWRYCDVEMLRCGDVGMWRCCDIASPFTLFTTLQYRRSSATSLHFQYRHITLFTPSLLRSFTPSPFRHFTPSPHYMSLCWVFRLLLGMLFFVRWAKHTAKLRYLAEIWAKPKTINLKWGVVVGSNVRKHQQTPKCVHFFCALSPLSTHPTKPNLLIIS